jgi:hypothetical protein
MIDFWASKSLAPTVHSLQYTVQTFSWLLLSFAAESSASGPQSGKAPYHSLPLPHLFYLYISGPNLWTTSMSLTLSRSFLLRLMPPNMEDFRSASFSFSRIMSAVVGCTLQFTNKQIKRLQCLRKRVKELTGIFSIFYVQYFISHCFICRHSDSTVSEDAWIEPWTVEILAFTVRLYNHSARSLVG